MKAFAIASLFVFAAATSARAEDKPALNVKEGQWETVIKMEMPGMPMALPPVTTSSCITKKDLVPQTQQPGQECKVKNQKVTGNTIEWAVECKDAQGNVTQGTGKITYQLESFQGSMAMAITAPGQQPMQMSYKMTGKRTGECKKTP